MQAKLKAGEIDICIGEYPRKRAQGSLTLKVGFDSVNG
jgi:hypothetical protein